MSAIGRIHDVAEARQAVHVAKDIFDRVNIDMMFGLPGQSIKEALADVREACSFKLDHISLYQLTLEPGTRFHHSPPAGMPDADTLSDMDDVLRGELAMSGLVRYEISAHARPGQECRHNLNYWRFGDYIGIGAGAHSKMTSENGVRREVRHKAPGFYMKKALAKKPVFQTSRLSRQDLAFEFMLNAMRLLDGIDERMFYERTGLLLSDIEKGLSTAREMGLAIREKGKIRPTKEGIDRNADLCSIFLPQEETTPTSEVVFQ